MVKSDFNLGWIFYKEGHERDKKEVALPHDAMIYEQRSREAVTAGHVDTFQVENMSMRSLLKRRLNGKAKR